MRLELCQLYARRLGPSRGRGASIVGDVSRVVEDGLGESGRVAGRRVTLDVSGWQVQAGSRVVESCKAAKGRNDVEGSLGNGKMLSSG